METPTSHNKIIISSRKIEESGKEIMKSRSALIDITNDSPIVGLAIGNMNTPSSTFYKKRMIVKDNTTPGSGEALLRDQVQTLLQKVEEEAVIKKITSEPKNIGNSPNYVLAPTPANTPQIPENNNGQESESFNLFQILDQEQEILESLEKDVITKVLFMDFPEKLEGCDLCLDDEDDESVCSVQVNASTSDEHEDDEEFEADYEDGMVDEVCEVMIKICVNDGAKCSQEHEGFVYDNDRLAEVEN